MLLEIREKVKGWLAWLLIGLLIVVFGLWGLDFIGGDRGSQAVAVVNGEDIQYQQAISVYQDAVAQQLAFMRENNLNIPINEELIKQQVLQSLVLRLLLDQNAKGYGYSVSDEQFEALLLQTPEFQEDGVFSSDRFALIAAQNYGTTANGLKQILIDSLRIHQLQAGIQDSAFYLQSEAKQALSLIQQKRTLSYLIIEAEKFLDEIDISAEDVENYYEQNKISFVTDEAARIDYVELSLDGVKANTVLSDDEVKDFYQNNLSQFSTQEQRRVSHILIELSSKAKQDDIDKANSLLKTLQDRLNQGEDFATLAQTYSQDIGSAKDGGDLGWISRDDAFDTSFVNAVYQMSKVGDVVAPVRTLYGVHLIKLTDDQPMQSEPLEAVRARIETQLRHEKSYARFLQQVDEMSLLAFEQPDSLHGLIDELGLEQQHSDFFGRSGGGGGITEEPLIIAATFSEDVLEGGNNSDLIRLDNDRVVVLRVAEYQPQDTQPLDKVSEQSLQYLNIKQQQTKLSSRVRTSLLDFSKKMITQQVKCNVWRQRMVFIGKLQQI